MLGGQNQLSTILDDTGTGVLTQMFMYGIKCYGDNFRVKSGKDKNKEWNLSCYYEGNQLTISVWGK